MDFIICRGLLHFMLRISRILCGLVGVAFQWATIDSFWSHSLPSAPAQPVGPWSGQTKRILISHCLLSGIEANCNTISVIYMAFCNAVRTPAFRLPPSCLAHSSHLQLLSGRMESVCEISLHRKPWSALGAVTPPFA